MRYGGRTLFSVILSGGDGVEDVTAIDTFELEVYRDLRIVEEYSGLKIVEEYSGLGIVEASDRVYSTNRGRKKVMDRTRYCIFSPSLQFSPL